MASAGTMTAIASAPVSPVGGVGGNRLAAARAEAAAVDGGGPVVRSAADPQGFRRHFRCRFRRPFRSESGARRSIRHGSADRAGSMLPTSPRPIEVGS